MVVLGYRAGSIAKKALKETLDDNLLGLAAETAYYFFFSLFPLLLFIAPLLSLDGNKQETVALVTSQLQQVVPREGWALIGGVIKDVVYAKNAPGLMSIGAQVAQRRKGAIPILAGLAKRRSDQAANGMLREAQQPLAGFVLHFFQFACGARYGCRKAYRTKAFGNWNGVAGTACQQHLKAGKRRQAEFGEQVADARCVGLHVADQQIPGIDSHRSRQ